MFFPLMHSNGRKNKQILPKDLFDISAHREEEHNMPILVLKQ